MLLRDNLDLEADEYTQLNSVLKIAESIYYHIAFIGSNITNESISFLAYYIMRKLNLPNINYSDIKI